MKVWKEEDIVSVERVEVKLLKPKDFIKSSLANIGIANREQKKLYPSCYLKVEGDQTFICHFKELLRVPRLTEVDVKRRNTVIYLLEKWELIRIENSEVRKDIVSNIQKKKVFILTKEQMNDGWVIDHKYHYEKHEEVVKNG